MLDENAVRATFEHIYGIARRMGFNVETCNIQRAAYEDDDSSEHIHMQWLLNLSVADVDRDIISGRDRLVEISEALHDPEWEVRIFPGISPFSGQTGRVAMFQVVDTPIRACVHLICVNPDHSEAELN